MTPAQRKRRKAEQRAKQIMGVNPVAKSVYSAEVTCSLVADEIERLLKRIEREKRRYDKLERIAMFWADQVKPAPISKADMEKAKRIAKEIFNER